ncbi:Uncharacterised protein [Nocardia africana]|uniref:Uncharacterized protein n=1 Tax=Nocardia africana TaxID=134964 RepID=A0A378WWZ9_9NOCA|nr:Uncharacterised protein [Nocardia africana]
MASTARARRTSPRTGTSKSGADALRRTRCLGDLGSRGRLYTPRASITKWAAAAPEYCSCAVMRLPGGSASSTAEEELRRYVPLLTGQASPTARRALFEAIGNLSGVAAFSAFDIADYRDAEQRFRFALWCADTAGSWELRASTLADMARKVAYVGSADDALSLIASTPNTVRSPSPATPPTPTTSSPSPTDHNCWCTKRSTPKAETSRRPRNHT